MILYIYSFEKEVKSITEYHSLCGCNETFYTNGFESDQELKFSISTLSEEDAYFGSQKSCLIDHTFPLSRDLFMDVNIANCFMPGRVSRVSFYFKTEKGAEIEFFAKYNTKVFHGNDPTLNPIEMPHVRKVGLPNTWVYFEYYFDFTHFQTGTSPELLDEFSLHVWTNGKKTYIDELVMCTFCEGELNTLPILKEIVVEDALQNVLGTLDPLIYNHSFLVPDNKEKVIIKLTLPDAAATVNYTVKANNTALEFASGLVDRTPEYNIESGHSTKAHIYVQKGDLNECQFNTYNIDLFNKTSEQAILENVELIPYGTGGEPLAAFGEIDGGFWPEKFTGYFCTVPVGTDNVTLIPVPRYPGLKVSINDVPYEFGSESDPVAINTTIQVKVETEDEAESNTYEIFVTDLYASFADDNVVTLEESGSPLILDVVLSKPSPVDNLFVDVTFKERALGSGVAERSVDFTFIDGTLEFDTGEQRKSIEPITPIADPLTEGPEELELVLQQNGNIPVVGKTSETVTITDDDTYGVQFQNNIYYVGEGDLNSNDNGHHYVQIPVVIDEVPQLGSYSVKVKCEVLETGTTAEKNVDFKLTTEELAWSEADNGDIVEEFVYLKLFDDDIAEPNKTIRLNLLPLEGTHIRETNPTDIVIVDNDKFTVSFTEQSMFVEEPPTEINTALVPIQLGPEILATGEGPVIVSVVVAEGTTAEEGADKDFVLNTPTIQWNPGDPLEHNIAVAIHPDAVDSEFEETIVLGIRGVVGGKRTQDNTYTITILDGTEKPVVYVNNTLTSGADNGTSWNDAFRGSDALEKGLDEAEDIAQSQDSKCHIWVAANNPGAPYRPSYGTDRGRTFRMRYNVELYGGFVGNEVHMSQRDYENNKTVLSGDYNNNDGTDFEVTENFSDNCYTVVTYSSLPGSEYSSTLLDGFTISGGYSGLRGNAATQNGGAIYAPECNVNIQNCIIENNYALDDGGGIFHSTEADRTVTCKNCKFLNNRSGRHGGAISCQVEQPNAERQLNVFNCSFENNNVLESDSPHTTFRGGAIYCHGGNLTASSNTFLNNYVASDDMTDLIGGAIALFECLGSYVAQNIFSGNEVRNRPSGLKGQGGALGYSVPDGRNLVSNNVFFKNRAKMGGAIAYFAMDQAEPEVKTINCTFVKNEASDIGGAIFDFVTTEIVNTIAWLNTSPNNRDISCPTGNPVVISYSNIQEQLYPGEGNKSENPIFASYPEEPNSEDLLALANSSPCIDGGTSENAPSVDIQGLSRPMGGGVDMGAHENPNYVASNLFSIQTPFVNDVEGEGNPYTVNVVVERPFFEQDVTVNFTVAGSATYGSDFTITEPAGFSFPNGQLVFSPGETNKTIQYTVADDGVPESTEDMGISLVSIEPALYTVIDELRKQYIHTINDASVIHTVTMQVNPSNVGVTTTPSGSFQCESGGTRSIATPASGFGGYTFSHWVASPTENIQFTSGTNVAQQDLIVNGDATITAEYTLSPKLIAHWPCNDDPTQLLDASGNGHHGTLSPSGVAVVNDGVSGDWADEFTSGGSVTIADHDDFKMVSEITLAAWVKLAEITNDHQALISKWYDQGAYDPSYILELSPEGKPQLLLRNSSETIGAVVAPNALPLNQWAFVVGTYDGTTVKIYVNGSLVNSAAFSGAINVNSFPVYLGSHKPWEDPDSFKGRMDEAKVYNNALDAATIQSLYDAVFYTVTVSAEANGSVSPSGEQRVIGGQQLPVLATPNPGYEFTDWYLTPNLTVVSGDETGVFTVAGEGSVLANFHAKTLSVTFDANGGSTPNPTAKSVTFGEIYGTLASTSRTGYTFAGWWYTNGVGVPVQVTASSIVELTSNHTLTAQWNINSYTVNVSSSGNGVVTPSGDQTINHGGILSVAATPNAGYEFTDWNLTPNITYVSGNETAEFTVIGEGSILANFHAKTLNITFDANGGSIPSPTSKSVTFGEIYGTLASTSRTGYTFAGWWYTNGVGVPVQATASSIVSLTSNHTLTAQWNVNHYTLTTTATNGSITKTPNASSYAYGTTVALQATPNTGYHFVRWEGSITGSVNPQNIIINGNKSVTAVFAPNMHVVTLNTNPSNVGVTTTPNGSFSFPHGSTEHIIAPTEGLGGYEFLEWSASPSANIQFNHGTGIPEQNIVVLGPATITANYILSPKLIAHWPCNHWDMNPIKVLDASGNGHDGIPATSGVGAWVGGVAGGIANEFDGGYVKINDHTDFDIIPAVTVASWVKLHQLSGDHQVIVSKWFDESMNNDHSYVLELSPDGKPQFVVRTTSGTGVVVAPNALNFYDWTFVVGTYDGATLKIYVNGTLVNSGSWSGDINVSTSSIYLGSHYSFGDPNRFYGRMDETRIYNYNLEPTTIQSMYNNVTSGWVTLTLPDEDTEKKFMINGLVRSTAQVPTVAQNKIELIDKPVGCVLSVGDWYVNTGSGVAFSSYTENPTFVYLNQGAASIEANYI